MAIYTRNKEGNLMPLKIPAIKGEDGKTPNIQIGTVITLDAGQQATVENVGTLENPVFNFGIPKGEDGTGGGGGITLEKYDLVYENGVNPSMSCLYRVGNVVYYYFRISGGVGIELWKQFTTIPEEWRPKDFNAIFQMYGDDGTIYGGFSVAKTGSVQFSSSKSGYTCVGMGVWIC